LPQAKTYLDPSSVFHGEVDESLDKVRTCLAVLRSFKSAYDDQKASVPELFGDKPPKLWDFKTDLVFGRLHAFTERAELIEVIRFSNDTNSRRTTTSSERSTALVRVYA
jgi:dynein heavy chain